MLLTGELTSLLHIIDLTNRNNPVLLKTFLIPSGFGRPHDIQVCGNVVAVSFSAQVLMHEGHVHFYRPYTTDQQGNTMLTSFHALEEGKSK